MTSEPGASGLQRDDPDARASEAESLRPFDGLPPSTCPIGWQPAALTPVFYGYSDYASGWTLEPGNAAEVDRGGGGGVVRPPPANMRVFFPTLDGSPQDAAILQGCGPCPLILFAHGDCEGDPDHYLKWYFLPAQLARAGYVVAVPQLPDISTFPPENTAAQDTLLAVLAWMREDWEYSDTLMPGQSTGLAGHSFGGMHAGILATKVDAACVVSLSGTWGQWTSAYGPNPITELQVPQLLTWGTGITEAFADAQLPDSLWDEIASPKHRVVFTGGEHFDYLSQFPLPCRTAQGSCSSLGPAAFDLTTMFFGRYLPPYYWQGLPDLIPVTLEPALPLTLTLDQQFYAGDYLNGLPAFDGDPQCSVSITQVVPIGPLPLPVRGSASW